MIYDVILVGIFLLLIIINAYRGVAKAFAATVCSLVSYLLATTLGKIASERIYEKFIRPVVDKAVINAVSKAVTDTATSVTEALPSWLSDLLKLSSVDLSDAVGKSLNTDASSITASMNDAVKPIAVSMISFLVTLLLFLLIYFLLRLLVVKPVLKLFALPGVRGINRLCGAAIGFIAAFLLVSLLAYLLRLLMPAIGSQSGILNESTIYNSLIFYHFYSGNIFTAITSAIGL